MNVIKLQYPITVNDETVSEIAIPERLTIKHLRALDEAQGEIGKTAALIGALAKLPRAAVDDIDAEDFGIIADKLNGFLSAFPSTGGM